MRAALDNARVMGNGTVHKHMSTLYTVQGLLRLGPLLVSGLLCAGTAAAVTYEDPEISPLYASSLHKVFAGMSVRDREQADGPLSSGARMKSGTVIVVEGAHWYAADASPKVLAAVTKAVKGGSGGSGGGTPKDITTDYTCAVTCAVSCSATTCGASCDATPTCRGYPTCHVPSATCIYATCDGHTPTCSSSQPTCFGVSCTQPGPTCSPCITSSGPSCLGTCTAASCPATLFNVNVPQAGQIQMSFASSSFLRYTLQLCTNLSGGQWADVNTVTGNGGTLTLSHTNSAARSFYRLWVQ
jgi:hypothetical protein